jgi:protein-tyrosine phosphatase
MAALLLWVEMPVFGAHEPHFVQTDEQAPLPAALSQLLERVTSTYETAGDFIFNCQMGRGRTTTGMITACLIATGMNLKRDECLSGIEPETVVEDYDAIDGPSEEEAYLQGMIISAQIVELRS